MTLCVFCGSSSGNQPAYLQAAIELGTLLAHRRIDLVYGGASIGLMGAVADAALSGGGKVIGILPKHLLHKEIAHAGLTELQVVPSMHARKAMMAERSDGFIAMPGGFGTFEEFFEVLTWAQLGLHQKPIGLLNVAGYYTPLLTLVNQSVQEGFIRPEHRDLVIDADNPETLLSRMQQFQPIALPKWIQEMKQS